MQMIIKIAGVEPVSHIFISYQHDDVDFAENLKQRLEKVGFKVWIDSEQLNAGDDWHEVIDEGIKTASALIVIITPAVQTSKYVTYEWAFAWGAGVPVIPILLKSTQIHPRLEKLKYEDFTHTRQWDRVLTRLKEVTKAPTKQLTSTIGVPDEAPPHLRQAITALDSPSITQRREALDTLAQMKPSVTQEILASALEHPHQDVSLNAALKLAEIGDQRAISYLIRFVSLEISNDNPSILHKFKSVENKFSRRIIRDLFKILLDEPINIESSPYKILLSMGSLAIPMLSEALGSQNQITRLRAIGYLGDIGDSRAVPTLIATLNGGDADQRVFAAEALGRIRDVQAVPDLINRLSDVEDSSFTSLAVCTTVAQALKAIGTPEALAAVEEWRKQQEDTKS